ncbi:MAG TPA: barstar family protein [Saprospiraceae bacterium]|nr:barstar family protein [Saprospiraceae bacterium]
MAASIQYIPSKSGLNSLDLSDHFVVRLYGSQICTALDFYQQIKSALSFPDYFGDNLDALYDCLMDLEWIPNQNVSIVLYEGDQIFEEDMDAEFLSDILILMDDVSESWAIHDNEDIPIKNFNFYIVESNNLLNLLKGHEIEFDFISEQC